MNKSIKGLPTKGEMMLACHWFITMAIVLLTVSKIDGYSEIIFCATLTLSAITYPLFVLIAKPQLVVENLGLIGTYKQRLKSLSNSVFIIIPTLLFIAAYLYIFINGFYQQHVINRIESSPSHMTANELLKQYKAKGIQTLAFYYLNANRDNPQEVKRFILEDLNKKDQIVFGRLRNGEILAPSQNQEIRFVTKPLKLDKKTKEYIEHQYEENTFFNILNGTKWSVVYQYFKNERSFKNTI